MIDVASGEYGYEYVDKMISQVDNGRCYNWTTAEIDQKENLAIENPHDGNDRCQMTEFEAEIDSKLLRARSSSWQQFCILFNRRTLQMWRDSVSEFPSTSYFHSFHTRFLTLAFYLSLDECRVT